MLPAIKQPNLREMFIPDPGFTLFDIDFGQADARVVAWDADAPRLKAVFNDPTSDVHMENAFTIFGERTDEARQLSKGGVHAVNYFVMAKTLATALGVTKRQAQTFIDTWLRLNPEIKQWHSDTKDQLLDNGTIHNVWGYRRQYFERPNRLLPEALAWIGQSTVAIAIKIAMNNLMELERQTDGDLQVLMQVHDSVLGQFRSNLYPTIRKAIRDAMLVTIPYEDPLVLPVDMKGSRKSWGHCQHIAGYKDGVLYPWEDSQQFCVY